MALRVLRLPREGGYLHALAVGALDDVDRRRTERVGEQLDRMRERDLDVSAGDVLGPANHALRPVAIAERRQFEAFDELGHVVPVPLGNHAADLVDQIFRRGAVHVGRLLGHDRVNAVRLSIDVLVDPVELDLELLGAEADRSEDAKSARLADGRHDIAAMGEREDRVLDPKHVAQWCAHRLPPWYSLSR